MNGVSIKIDLFSYQKSISNQKWISNQKLINTIESQCIGFKKPEKK